MEFAGEGGVRGEASSESPSQLGQSPIQLGALSLELGDGSGSLGEGTFGAELVVEEGECGVREVRGWWQGFEPLHRQIRVSMLLEGSSPPCAVFAGVGFR